MSFIKNLQVNINKVTEGYFANWTPDMPVSVGDYGYINGYRLTKDGNIGRFIQDPNIEEVRSKTATFEKKDGVTIRAVAAAEGDVTVGKAKLELKFGSEGSFLYHLKDLTNIQFEERQKIFGELGALILSEKIRWKDDYVLVTEVKQAEKALVIVADSADTEMEIECSSEEASLKNLATVVGGINYYRDSNQVVRYEIEQNSSLLFRIIEFTEVPPDGGPNGPVSQLVEKVRAWFADEMPEPESIYLHDYVESDSAIEGTFVLPNGEPITLCQKVENILSFIEKSERQESAEEHLEIETVEIREQKAYM